MADPDTCFSVSGAEYASEDPGFNPRPIDALRDEVANASRRSFPMFTADEVQTALDEIDRLSKLAARVGKCIKEWDMLMVDGEGRGVSIGDAPWMRAMGDELLAAAQSTSSFQEERP